MNDVYLRRIGLLAVGAVVVGGALRLWAAIEFPTLDMYDNGPVWIGVSGSVACVAGLWWLLRTSSVATRLMLVPVGLAAGWWLCFGAASVVNGVFDRSPTRSLRYTVAAHRQSGRGSAIYLQRAGTSGPAWLRLRERRETVGLAIGTPVTVPVRDGPLTIAWRPGPVAVDA